MPGAHLEGQAAHRRSRARIDCSLVWLVAATLGLQACGGGAGDSNPGPSPSPAPPTITVSPSGAGLVNGTQFSFTATPASTQGLSWQFGDGTSASGGPAVTHTYAQAGKFTVQVTAAGQSGATTSVRVVSSSGKWYGLITGHSPRSSVTPITSFEVDFNEPLPGSSLSPLNASWADNAGCKTTTRIFGKSGHPRYLTFGIESFSCNASDDFYLVGSGDDQMEVITGTCGATGSGCRFKMTRSLDLSGQWRGEYRSFYAGGGAITGTFSHSGSALTGSVSVTNAEPCFSSGPVSGSVSGSSVTIGVTYSNLAKVTFTGAIAPGGGSMSGQYDATSACGVDRGTWKLLRQ